MNPSRVCPGPLSMPSRSTMTVAIPFSSNQQSTVLHEATTPAGGARIVTWNCVFHTAVAVFGASIVIGADVPPVPVAPPVQWTNTSRFSAGPATVVGVTPAVAGEPASYHPSPDSTPHVVKTVREYCVFHWAVAVFGPVMRMPLDCEKIAPDASPVHWTNTYWVPVVPATVPRSRPANAVVPAAYHVAPL